MKELTTLMIFIFSWFSVQMEFRLVFKLAKYPLVHLLQFYGLLKSGVDCEDFVKKIENAQASLPRNIAGMTYMYAARETS